MNSLQSHINPLAIKIILHFQKHVYFKLSIVKARKTKLGDYRYDPNKNTHSITINNDLLGDAFLYTALHEIAHQHTQVKHGRFVQPHGEEWKANYKKILLFALEKDAFENPNIIIKSLDNIGYSSSTNQEIYKTLYSNKQQDEYFVDQVPINGLFVLKNHIYKKIKQNTKRSLCRRQNDGKDFFVSNVATVTLVNH